MSILNEVSLSFGIRHSLLNAQSLEWRNKRYKNKRPCHLKNAFPAELRLSYSLYHEHKWQSEQSLRPSHLAEKIWTFSSTKLRQLNPKDPIHAAAEA
jgi:hypothetical protein